MNTQQQHCVPQRQPCLSTYVTRELWGKHRGEGDTVLRGAGRVETTGKSNVLFTQGA